MQSREFTDLDDLRLVYRGNKILLDLFQKNVHSIRQVCSNDSEAKGFYRFLQNDRVSEEDILSNMLVNCKSGCADKYVICIQDSTEINLSGHRNRIKKDGDIGTTNSNNTQGLGFFLHPSFVLDAYSSVPYGFATVKIWNRPLDYIPRAHRKKQTLPIEEKESYKWIETSQNTKSALSDTVKGMVIIQDREGDIYEQFALIPDNKTELLIRSRIDRKMVNGQKLYNCCDDQECQGSYTIDVEGKGGRKKRKALIEIRYKKVSISKTKHSSKEIQQTTDLYYIQAKEVNYSGNDRICWRLLTSIPTTNIKTAIQCVEWYSWRWSIEEVFKVLKKEGFNIEATELEYASSVRKLSLMILEVIIKLFLMRLAYEEPEIDLEAEICFNKKEQEFLEHQIKHYEGKTEKQKNPFKNKDLKRYVWVIARMGGWKGYEWKRHPGITTLWIGFRYYRIAMQGWELNRNVSTR